MSNGITRENMLLTLPAVIRKDPSADALADALAQVLENRKPETDLPRIFPALDRLPEAVIDILAHDLKVDWYDYDYPVSVKLKLVKGSVLAHKHLGTLFAVRSAVNSLYPDSEIEEWFDYGGENGNFRININITRSAENDAPLVYPPEEIKRRIETVKRLAARLENIGYMVKRGIVIQRQTKSYLCRPPECGTIRCGTHWMPSTLGKSLRPTLETKPKAEAIPVKPELTGTLPETAEAGYSVSEILQAGGNAEGYADRPEETGTSRSGTVWTRKVLGWSGSAELSANGAAAEAFLAEPEFTGTLPEEAEHGN